MRCLSKPCLKRTLMTSCPTKGSGFPSSVVTKSVHKCFNVRQNKSHAKGAVAPGGKTHLQWTSMFSSRHVRKRAVCATVPLKRHSDDRLCREHVQVAMDLRFASKQATQPTLRARAIEHAAHSCVELVRGDGVRRILLLVSCHGNVEPVLVSQSHICSASM